VYEVDSGAKVYIPFHPALRVLRALIKKERTDKKAAHLKAPAGAGEDR